MKLVIYPAVDDARLENIESTAGLMSVVNVDDAASAVREITDADAFFGKLTPEMLAAATQGCSLPVGLLQAYLDNHGDDFQLMVQKMRGWLEITALQAAQKQLPNWQVLQTTLHTLRAALPCTSPIHQGTLEWLATLQGLDLPNLMATVKRKNFGISIALHRGRFYPQ